MAHHNLKTDPHEFTAVVSGVKDWEVRKNDRKFSVGDLVTLQETRYTAAAMARDPDMHPLVYTGREISGTVLYKLEGYGLQDGHCVLSIKWEQPQSW